MIHIDGIKCDANWMIVDPDLHDAAILSLNVPDRTTMQIILSSLRRTKHTITLHNVTFTLVNEFSNDNIVLAIFWKPIESKSVIDEVFLKTAGAYRTQILFDNAESAGQRLFLLSPSCGAEIAAICSRITIT